MSEVVSCIAKDKFLTATSLGMKGEWPTLLGAPINSSRQRINHECHVMQSRWTWPEWRSVLAHQLNHHLAPPAVCRGMIECARHAVDGARRDLYVMSKNERTAAGALAKFGGSLFKRVCSAGAVSNLYGSTEDGHVPSVSYPTTVETR